MAVYTVDVYAFFVNSASPRTNIGRIKQDIINANRAWNGCIKFDLKDIHFCKKEQILNAGSISTEKVFRNQQINLLYNNARNTMNNKIGIYVFYLNGKYLDEVNGRRVVGVAGTELIDYKHGKDYKLIGRVLLTEMAGPFTFAHECGHVLFKRYHSTKNTFIHNDPSGPYINPKTKKIDSAHNNDRNNLMFPISPFQNPMITSEQCKIAKLSKITRKRMVYMDEDFDVNFF
ncbi:hypothetical protein IEC97_26015 [Neobacillus cucumis]|uniref:hypothetical protein n=1 Tax=Neobacillus cucumis TaxID=1740721 RepID=UPI0018E03D52|nr:hypothetical protein [Neobacillus cucumis]MBI0580798.1 hypothetical protein [Neobacillus cucumis]